MASRQGLAQLERMQGIIHGDGARNDHALWIEGDRLYFDGISIKKSGPSFSAVPTTGTWLRGDIVWNSTPSLNGAPGWVCVVAGTPGTWCQFWPLANGDNETAITAPNPLIWPYSASDGAPAIYAKDRDGDTQKLIAQDAESTTIVGASSKLSHTSIFQLPLNIFKVHVQTRFNKRALDPDWGEDHFGGSVYIGSNGEQILTTTSTSGRYSRIYRPNSGMQGNAGSGSVAYFYVTAMDTLNQEITFGLEDEINPTTIFVRFRLTEAGSAGVWQAESARTGTTTVTTNQSPTVPVERTMFIIDLRTAGHAYFWMTDMADGSRTPDLVADIDVVANLPASTNYLRPFMKIANTASADKRLSLSQQYLLANA